MDALRSLPKVDSLSRSAALKGFPERIRTEASRRAIEEMRELLQAGGNPGEESAEIRALARAEEMTAESLRPIVNLSGVILHTGLGRARLAKSATQHVAAVAGQHSMLELDDETGKRGDRQSHVRDLLRQVTGAEDALVVNNAAAAVVLSLSALARNREVLLSRGQMIEIGGSFRMPEIVRESGCTLVEVGCTNKTRLSDYEGAIGEATGAILRCHPSNYKIVGFTEEPALQELAQLAHAYGVICIDDMGTGCVVDTSSFGIPKIPTIQDSLRENADVVIASGDKLLGGPQAGLILGRADLIAKIKVHPLARAVRADKLTLAGLESTLHLYVQGREREIPTITYLSRPLAEVRTMAETIAGSCKGSCLAIGTTEIGGGSAPGTGVPTWRAGISGAHPDELAKRLRANGIIGRIEADILWLDPRTIDESELDYVGKVLKSL